MWLNMLQWLQIAFGQGYAKQNIYKHPWFSKWKFLHDFHEVVIKAGWVLGELLSPVLVLKSLSA
jgi:hypothetical protein